MTSQAISLPDESRATLLAGSLIPGLLGYFLLPRPEAGQLAVPLLSFFVVLPMLVSFLMIVAPGKSYRWLGLAVSALTVGMSIRLFGFYGQAPAGFQFTEQVPWLSNLGINYIVAVDGISVLMVILTSVIYFTGTVTSWNMEPRGKEFFVLFNLLVGGVFGVFVSLDLFFFFMFYELAVLPMYLLIGIWGSGPKEYAAMKLTLYLLAGSAFMLVAFIAMYFGSAVHTFDLRVLMDPVRTAFSFGFQKFWFPFLFVGFGVIGALWPLHTWSPDGHSSAPTSVSMLHAGVLMKLGGFGIIRVALPCMPDGARYWLPLFALLTIVNILYGSIAALKQTDLKFVTAYSSVSHCGYVLFGICTMDKIGINGAVMQMFSHGIMTALFFCMIGFIYGRTHTRDIPKLGGLLAVFPLVGSLYIATGMASVGLPGMSGFVAEFMILVGAYQSGYQHNFGYFKILFPMAILAVGVTAIYVLRVLQNVFYGPVKDPHYKGLPQARFIEYFPMALLMGVILMVGLYPKPFVDLVNTAVGPLIDHVGGFK